MKTAILLFALVCLSGVYARTASGCPPTHYTIEQYQCGACHASCQTCDGPTATDCTACSAGELTEGACLSVLGSFCGNGFCNAAESSVICDGCAAGYYAKKNADEETTGICEGCGVALTNCAECSDATTCTKCAGGFFSDAAGCTACVDGCADCSDSTTCNTCKTGYVKNAENKCTACGTGCSECAADDANKCSACFAGSFLDTETSTCTTITGCEEGADKKCTVCMDGYRPVAADNSCAKCSGSALTCGTASDAQKILSCIPTKIMTVAGTTVTEIKCNDVNANCVKQDSDGVCQTCAKNYVLDAGVCKMCSAVSTGCNACTGGATAADAATCTGCAAGYRTSGATPLTCTACPGTTVNGAGKTIIKCNSCDAAACTECASGHYNSAASGSPMTCSACGSWAATCTDNLNADTCEVGGTVYNIIDVGICRKCIASHNCKTCTNFGTCTACPDSATMSITSTGCKTCAKHCDTGAGKAGCVTEGEGKCGADCLLVDGVQYYPDLVAKNCISQAECKVTNCASCNTSDMSKCATCNDTFYADAQGVCKSCAITGCKDCQADNTKCADTKCMLGYASNNAGDNCVACQTITVNSTCDKETGANAACAAGYGISATDATKCEPCQADCKAATVCTNGGKCKAASATTTECAKGGLNTGTVLCEACNTGIATCGDGDKAYAISCDPVGYIIGTNVCDTCATNCDTCTTKAQCDAAGCKKGFGLQGTSAGTSACTACIANCDQCDTNATTCDAGKCSTGFLRSADGTKCETSQSIANCTTMSATVSDECGTCAFGTYKAADSKTCPDCTNKAGGCGCTTAAPASCTCPAGSVAATDKCEACTLANCLTCDGGKDVCTVCKAGYVYNGTDKVCDECAPNCDVCLVAKKGGCDTCSASFGLSGQSKTQKICAPCPANCATCTHDAVTEVATCTKCNAAMYLSAAGACVNTNCLKSTGAEADGTKCTRCPYGFKLAAANTGCVDCKADNSCAKSCTVANPPPVTPGGNTTTNDSGTSNSSIISFSLFVLAFVAILGHMII